jgi:hypothetical protein
LKNHESHTLNIASLFFENNDDLGKKRFLGQPPGENLIFSTAATMAILHTHKQAHPS